MCLYPKLAINKKYTANKKNGGIIPAVLDTRVLFVPLKCGQCMECKKQKAREWTVRLQEDIKHNKNGKFITLTFSNESIEKLTNDIKSNGYLPEGYALDNAIATKGMRMFNERWRKKFKKAIRHWTITELGHKNTENIHLHGIVWTDESYDTIRDKWDYGFIYPRSEEEARKCYVNNRTINYTTKYITKIDKDHKYYNPIILSSPGIGKQYTENDRSNWLKNKYNGEETLQTYRTETGHQIALPIYWRNKIYNEQEREALWLIQLDKQTRWINGIKIDISKGEQNYYNILKQAQKLNKELGYGTNRPDWNRKKYEEERRKIIIQTRIEKAIEKRGYELWKPIDTKWWEH